jgi:hypothetical protein
MSDVRCLALPSIVFKCWTRLYYTYSLIQGSNGVLGGTKKGNPFAMQYVVEVVLPQHHS